MSAQSPVSNKPPRLIFSLLVLAIALIVSLVFAKAFEQAPAYSNDPTLCGNPAPLDSVKPEQPDEHDTHEVKKAKPIYFVGGLWTPKYGLGPLLDAGITGAAKEGRPIICLSAIAAGEEVVIIDHTPIQLQSVANNSKPDLILSIDYTGGISSMEYPAAAALQKYITDEKGKYQNILIIEPLPGPKPDPDEDWTYLNFDGDDNINFITPKRKSSPIEVATALLDSLQSAATSSDLTDLIEQLGSAETAKAAQAQLQLSKLNPYEVIPAIEKWLSEAEAGAPRDKRLYAALMIRRAMGIHADSLIAEAAASENVQLRALAARTIGDLANVTTDPIGKLTPLAEDDEMAVRYEALIATRTMPGRRAAGVAELVEPYEMTDAMRSVYQGTLAELLTYGEPIAADSKANRLRRMTINDLLNEERAALVCMILLEREDLPDDKIDEVLGQLAKANGQGPLVALLNLLEAMNPRTLAKREVLLEKLVAWKTNELSAQTPRLKEMALGNGQDNLRRAAAAALAMSSEPKALLTELGNSPIAYEGLSRVRNQDVLKRWAGPIMEQVKTGSPAETTIAAIDAVRLIPADSLTAENGTLLLGLAKSSDDTNLRFAAIRAVNALPAGIKPANTEDLTLTSLEITAQAGMKYDKLSLTVTAGRPVELTLINPDTMEHNLVITLPGRAQEIGVAMSADPTAAAAIGYVPKDSDAVLHYTRMLKPGESDTLRFIAPAKPGKYEYVCTFPGHYGSMRGVLEVNAP